MPLFIFAFSALLPLIITYNLFQALCYPSAFRIKTSLLIEIQELVITIYHIEPNAKLKLTKTDWAQRKGPSITLLQVVRSIHDTPEEYAVLQRKHVTYFMGQDLAGSPHQDLLIVLSPLFSVERWIIPGKTEDTNPIAQGGLTEDEIP